MVQEANGVNIINIRAYPNCLQMIKPLREGPVREALNMSLWWELFKLLSLPCNLRNMWLPARTIVYLLQKPLSVFASEHHNGNPPPSQNRKKWEKSCTDGYAALLITVPSSNMELLESSLNRLWIPRLREERSRQIQTFWGLLSDLLLLFQSSVSGPQSISQGRCGLHAKKMKSTGSHCPWEGVISWVFFSEPA